MLKSIRMALAICFVLDWVATQGNAAPGDLDTTFSGGTVSDDFGGDNRVYDSTLCPSGKIAIVSYCEDTSGTNVFLVAQYNTNGTPDTSFSSDGIVSESFFGYNSYPKGITSSTSGHVIAVGRVYTGSDYSMGIVRYTSDGTLDTTFNGTGILTTNFGTSSGDDSSAYCVRIDNKNKILVGGFAQNAGQDNFCLARYNWDGTPDTGFGSGAGYITTDFGDDTYIKDILIDSFGRIVAFGQYDTGDNADFAFACYTTMGALYTGFNGTGMQIIGSIGEDIPGGIDCWSQTGGLAGVVNRYVFCGTTYHPDISDYVVGVLDRTGNLDTTFNGTGYDSGGFSSAYDAAAWDVAVDARKRIIITGYNLYYGYETALAKYFITGSLDSSFGSGGIAIGLADQAYMATITLDGAGHIYTAGFSYPGGSSENAIIHRFDNF